jgi:CheY-like chemotaxis protein
VAQRPDSRDARAPAPLGGDAPALRDVTVTPRAFRAARALRILLAEDNPVNQRVAVGLLAKRGHEVTVAGNGVEAVAACARQPFDVVLMDMQMPCMGGVEATAAIRAQEGQSPARARIVALTAHAMAGDRERCLAAGMDDYVSKPIDPAVLYAAIEREPGPAGESTPFPSRTVDIAVDSGVLLARLDNDAELLAAVVYTFLADCPHRLAAIKGAVDARNAEQIRAASHALAGSAANVAATGLFDAARTLGRIGAEHRLDAAGAGWRRLSTEAALAMNALRELASGCEVESACAH